MLDIYLPMIISLSPIKLIIILSSTYSLVISCREGEKKRSTNYFVTSGRPLKAYRIVRRLFSLSPNYNQLGKLPTFLHVRARCVVVAFGPYTRPVGYQNLIAFGLYCMCYPIFMAVGHLIDDHPPQLMALNELARISIELRADQN